MRRLVPHRPVSRWLRLALAAGVFTLLASALAIGSAFIAENALHVHVRVQPQPRDADRLAGAA